MLSFAFVRTVRELCTMQMNEDDAMKIHSYMLTFASQMLRIKSPQTHLQALFDQGIVELVVHILEQSYESMFYEVLEALNLILANSVSYYPDSLLRSITKLSDYSYLADDIETIYMRIYVLTVLSQNNKSIEFFKDSKIGKTL